MPLFRSCLCWSDVRTGSVAAGVFTATMSVIQVILQVAVWTGHGDRATLRYLPFLLYVPLACMDFLLFIFTVIMLMGLEKNESGRRLLFPWVVVMVVYLLYEAAINLHLFIDQFPLAISIDEEGPGAVTIHQLTNNLPLDAVVTLPYLVVLVLYYVIKTALNFMGMLCVISRYQELDFCTTYRHRPLRNLSGRGGSPKYLGSLGKGPTYPGDYYDDSRPRGGYIERPRSHPRASDVRRYYDNYGQGGGVLSPYYQGRTWDYPDQYNLRYPY